MTTFQRVTSDRPSQCHTSTVWADSLAGVAVVSTKEEKKKGKKKIKKEILKNSSFAYKTPKVGKVSAYVQNIH